MLCNTHKIFLWKSREWSGRIKKNKQCNRNNDGKRWTKLQKLLYELSVNGNQILIIEESNDTQTFKDILKCIPQLKFPILYPCE